MTLAAQRTLASRLAPPCSRGVQTLRSLVSQLRNARGRSWRMAVYFVAFWLPLLWINEVVLDYYGISYPPSYDEGSSISDWILIDWVLISTMMLSQGVLGFLLSESLERRRVDRLRAEELRFTFLGRIAASVAHEMRNPLHNLRLLSEHLRDHRPPGDAATLDKLDDNLERLDQAVLLTFELARPPLDAWTTDATSICDLREVARQAIDEQVARLPQSRINADLGGHPVLVLGREVGLRAAIENLLRNALSADPERMATVTLTADPHAPRLTIANRGSLPEPRDGDGFPLMTGRGAGFGIGLGIARQLVIIARGRLSLHSGDGLVEATLILCATEVPT